jgi:hypothetical protein
MVQGQAAGTAAALTVRAGLSPSNIDIEQLQAVLSDQNVLLKPVPDPL